MVVGRLVVRDGVVVVRGLIVVGLGVGEIMSYEQCKHLCLHLQLSPILYGILKVR